MLSGGCARQLICVNIGTVCWH